MALFKNHSKAVCSDTPNHISSHGSKRLAGAKQASSGHAANPRSVQHASYYHQTLVALAPSTVAGDVHGASTHFNTIGSRVAATGGTQRNASVNSRSAAQPWRVCSHCGTSKCPGKTWRRGPAGPRSLCNACGLIYSRLGADGLKSSSRAASTAAPELAADAVAELPTAQPQMARVSSSCNNRAGVSDVAAASAISTAALPDAALTASNHSSSPSAAAASVQPRSAQQSESSTADRTEHSNTRRSLRQKRPRVRYGAGDSLELGRNTRARKSSTAAAATAATGSKTRHLQRQKRQRDPRGEPELLHPGKVAKTSMLASTAAAAASGVVHQAESAVPGLGALQGSTSEVAPGAAGFRVRKSYRVAQQKARQCEAVNANKAAAAAEAQEAAETLLRLAGCCWVETLVVALRKELDTV